MHSPSSMQARPQPVAKLSPLGHEAFELCGLAGMLRADLIKDADLFGYQRSGSRRRVNAIPDHGIVSSQGMPALYDPVVSLFRCHTPYRGVSCGGGQW